MNKLYRISYTYYDAIEDCEVESNIIIEGESLNRCIERMYNELDGLIDIVSYKELV